MVLSQCALGLLRVLHLAILASVTGCSEDFNNGFAVGSMVVGVSYFFVVWFSLPKDRE